MESQEKDVGKTSEIVLWQQQAEWRRTGTNLAETSGQRRPDEDMLREEETCILFSFCHKSICFIHYLSNVIVYANTGTRSGNYPNFLFVMYD